MAWSSNWPISATVPITDISAYSTLIELWEAVRERHWCYTGVSTTDWAGYHPWPPVNDIHAFGTITALVDNGDGTWTLTDSSKAAAPGTDDGRYWDGAERNPAAGCGTHPQFWTSLSCSNAPYLDGMYDVIVEYDAGDGGLGLEWYRTIKPWYPMRGSITGNKSQSLTFTAKLENFAVAKLIPSTASLVGKRYYVIKTGKLWWADKSPLFGRWPDWPNDNELWRGNADAGKFYSDNTGWLKEETNKVLRDPYNSSTLENNSWGGNSWKDKNVLVYDHNGNLKRLVPSSNNGNTIFFGGRTSIPTSEEEADLTISYEMDGDFTVCAVDAKGFPERLSWAPFQWYSGYFKQYYGHGPTYDGSDVLNRYPKIIAGDTYTYFFSADGSDCVSDDAKVTAQTLYNDVRTPVQNFCTPADFYPAPELYKSLGMLQFEIMGLIAQFVRPVSYTSAKEILAYSIARCFYDCSINSGTTTVSKDSVTVSGVTTTRYYFTATGDEYKNQVLYYEAVQSGVRKTAQDENAGADANGRINVHTTTDVDLTTHDADWLGATVYWSAGFTRYYPLLVTHFYPRWFFVPDIDVDDLGNRSAIYPPLVQNFADFGCFGTGSGGGSGYFKREPSTSYKIYDERGEAQEDGRTFVEGDVVRLDGNNWHDPGTGDTVRDGDAAEELPYIDRQFFGKHKRQIHPRILGELSGTITEGGKYFLTDSTKNWWRDWFEGGEMVVHSGSADSGSSTTLTTDGTWNDPTNENHCWFQLARFTGWTAPFVDFILEVDKVESGATVTYKLPTTNVTTDGTKQVFHFAAVDTKDGTETLTVANGDAWRIREPGTKLNRYRGHRIEVTKDDGTKLELDCNLSDDKSLFFDALTQPLLAGWSYQIIEYYPGGCWKFTTTEPTAEEKASGLKWQKVVTNKYFVQPVGADSRVDPATGLAPDWHKDMTENEPHKGPKRFGLIRKGDYINYVTLNEMYAVLNRLKHVKIGGTWTNYTYWSSPNGDWTTADDGTGSISDNGGGAPVAPATISTTLIDPWISIPSVNTPAYLMPVTSSGNSGDYDFSGGFSGFGPFSGTDPFTVYELAVRLESVAGYNYSAMLGSVGWGDDSSGNLANLASTTRSEVTVSPHARYRGATQTWYDGSSWEDPYTTNPHTPGWFVQFSRAGAHLTATATTLFPFTADFYVYAHAPIPESAPGDAVFTAFDDNGDDVLEDQFQKFNSQSIAYADKDKPLWSIRLGDTSSGSGRPAVYEPDLSGETVDETIIIGNGYEVSKQQIVAKFDVTGGLSKV
jgi:hypothetical protein